jgi:transcriptional regulator with XRE-family HTH domain
MLRSWRVRRRFSQLEMGAVVGVSPRHISFVETGRSRPSREMVLHLSRFLDVPLRQRNAILLAAGHSPEYRESTGVSTADDVAFYVERVLSTQRYPSVVLDKRWNIQATNPSADALVRGVARYLIEPNANLIALSLHRDGLGGRIVNFNEYASHIIRRMRHVTMHDPDPSLLTILDTYGHLEQATHESSNTSVLPLTLQYDEGTVTLFSTTTTFAVPREVHLSELVIETFYPIDDNSERCLERLTHPI